MFRLKVLALVVVGVMSPDAIVRAQGKVTGQVEEIRRSPWIDTIPVAPPSGVPLAGVVGTDADGYPTQFVDRPALRSLLLNRRFTELTAAFEFFQTEFERDPHREVWMSDATTTVGMPHPAELELIDEWMKATPRSFAPYLARARYGVEIGFLYRGDRWAKDTSDAEFAAMEGAFVKAERDAKKAIELRPRLIEVRTFMMKAATARGDRADAARWVAEGLRQCPTCYEIRAEWAGWVLAEKWGGSPDEIEGFTAKNANPAERRHRLLAGFVDFDRAVTLQDHQDGPAALKAIERACALGDDWRFLRERAGIKRRMGDNVGRLADLDRADAARPGFPSLVAVRAWALADANRWEDAGRDLLFALRGEPTSKRGAWLYPGIVARLNALGWTAHQEGRSTEAIRIFNLLQMLAPRDEQIARRAAAVRLSGAGEAERK